MIENCFNVFQYLYRKCVEFLAVEGIVFDFPILHIFFAFFILGILIDVFVLRV